MKNLIIALFFLGDIFAKLFSQTNPSWINYNYSDWVLDIEINNNNVLVATGGGLVKYNKTTGEKTFYNRGNSNFPDNQILSLSSDAKGIIWMGFLNYGIAKFNEEQCIIYNKSNSGLPFDFRNKKIKIDNEGSVWVASFSTMARFKGGEWKSWVTSDSFAVFPIISDFVIDNKGVVWLCSYDGFGKIDNDKYTIIPGFFRGIDYCCMGIDNNKRIWIGTHEKGMYYYNGTSFINYNDSNSCLPTNNIRGLSFDSQNNIWLATDIGLVKFNISECNLYKPAKEDSFLLCVKADIEGKIWCGTDIGNLLCFDGNKFTVLDMSNSPLKNNMVTDILIDDNNTKWIGTGNNLVKKTDTQFSSIIDSYIIALATDSADAVWVAYGSGSLLKIKNGITQIFDSTNLPFSPGKINIFDLIVDNNNILWIASGQGLYKYDGQTWTTYNKTNSPLSTNNIAQLNIDNNNVLWLSTLPDPYTEKGLLINYNGVTWKTVATCATIGYWVSSMVWDKQGNLWFGVMDRNVVGIEYGGGLFKYDGNTFIHYYVSNSDLPCNSVSGLCLDNEQNLWIGTYGGGLAKFDRKDTWSVFNNRNSPLPDNNVERLEADTSGNIWAYIQFEGITVIPKGAQPDITNIKVIQSNANNAISIYPNPFTDFLTLKLENASYKGNVNIAIFNMSGQKLVESNKKLLNNNTIELPVTKLSEGIYILHVSLANNKSYRHLVVKR